MEAVEAELSEQLGEAADNVDLIMAAIASYKRVTKNLPPGVHVHYDGTVYAPAGPAVDVEQLVDRAFDDELLIRVGELRAVSGRAGDANTAAEGPAPPRPRSAVLRRASLDN
jgi:hypothetical protein